MQTPVWSHFPVKLEPRRPLWERKPMLLRLSGRGKDETQVRRPRLGEEEIDRKSERHLVMSKYTKIKRNSKDKHLHLRFRRSLGCGSGFRIIKQHH